jgi:hypothetical protein
VSLSGRLCAPATTTLARQKSPQTVATFPSRQRKLRDVSADEESWSPPAAPVAHFDPVEVVSRQAVTIRFASGAVMGIPEDREDLVKAAVRALSGEVPPC